MKAPCTWAYFGDTEIPKTLGTRRVFNVDAHKPYEFTGFGEDSAQKPYEFIGFGDDDAQNQYEFIGLGDDDAQHPMNSQRVWAQFNASAL